MMVYVYIYFSWKIVKIDVTWNSAQKRSFISTSIILHDTMMYFQKFIESHSGQWDNGWTCRCITVQGQIMQCIGSWKKVNVYLFWGEILLDLLIFCQKISPNFNLMGENLTEVWKKTVHEISLDWESLSYMYFGQMRLVSLPDF